MTTHHFIAYLDPGSSAVILQMIGGGVAAFVVAMKLYGRRVLHALHLRRRDSPATAEPAATDEPAQ